jgi:hypothetical protein
MRARSEALDGEAGKIRVDPTNANRVYNLDPNTCLQRGLKALRELIREGK